MAAETPKLIEIDSNNKRIVLTESDLRQQTNTARDFLDKTFGTATEHLVMCFDTSWEAIVVTRAALSRGDTAQPWQYSKELSNWKGLRRRCNNLRRFAQKPILVTNSNLRDAFLAENLKWFERVVVLDLPDEPERRKFLSLGKSGKFLATETKIYLGTDAAPGNATFVALSGAQLASRRAAPSKTSTRLEVAEIGSSLGIERCLERDTNLVVINSELAAKYPTIILTTASEHNVTQLQLSPGFISRLVQALDKELPGVDLDCLECLEVSGVGISLDDVIALAGSLRKFGAKNLHVQFDYRTTACGLITTTGPIECNKLASTTRQGIHVALGLPIDDGAVRIVNQAYEPLAENEIGRVQVRQSDGSARHYVEPTGKLASLGHATGWIETGDLGFLNEAGLTVTSRLNQQITVPHREFQLTDIEARLRKLPDLRPEMLAALSLERGREKRQILAICFCSQINTGQTVAKIAADIFLTVVSITGLQPEVYHCRENQFPMTRSLQPNRRLLQQMINSGALSTSAIPRQSFDQPDMMSLAQMQQRVGLIWQNVLKLDMPPGNLDDFVTLGGDSLELTTMLNEVEAMFRQPIDIEAFFKEPSVNGLCTYLQNNAGKQLAAEPISGDTGDHLRKISEFVSVWRGEKSFPDSLLRGLNTKGSKPPLFWCMNSQQSFHKLANALGQDQPLYVMRSAVGVVEHYTQDTLEEISNRYLWETLALCQGRQFYLGGNCQGAIIALSLARRLQQIGQEPARLIMMEWFFEFGGYDGPTTFLTGEDSFVAELQQSVPSLSKLKTIFPNSDNRSINGSHGQFFLDTYLPGVAEGIEGALSSPTGLHSLNLSAS